MGAFGLIFSTDGEQLFLRTAGAGGPLSNLDVADSAHRLERVLASMTADPVGALSSIDVLDDEEQSRLDGWGNRAALSQPTAQVSIPALWAEQVARTPEAVAVSLLVTR